MNKPQILKKAFDIAMSNGYKPHKGYIVNSERYFEVMLSNQRMLAYLLLSHKFAKSLFGECTLYHKYKHGENLGIYCKEIADIRFGGIFKEINGWKYHLKRLVILRHKDKLCYIGDIIAGH